MSAGQVNFKVWTVGNLLELGRGHNSFRFLSSAGEDLEERLDERAICHDTEVTSVAYSLIFLEDVLLEQVAK